MRTSAPRTSGPSANHKTGIGGTQNPSWYPERSDGTLAHLRVKRGCEGFWDQSGIPQREMVHTWADVHHSRRTVPPSLRGSLLGESKGSKSIKRLDASPVALPKRDSSAAKW
ncbi:hypothetical protein BaRGS_00015298 [Batillaria attramentaria]|uniref:Uncharacterized protein n=1 Tax=Batillaria attramentaria TaxID=370345 RepID=A0ABD0L2F5_9CAEN